MKWWSKIFFICIGRALVQTLSQVKNFIIVETLWYRVCNIEMKGTNEKRTDLTIHFPPPLDWQEINDLISQSPCFFSNVFLFFSQKLLRKKKLAKLPPHKYFFFACKVIVCYLFFLFVVNVPSLMWSFEFWKQNHQLNVS